MQINVRHKYSSSCVFERDECSDGGDEMDRQWNWLIGRKLSLGEVIDVSGESATVRHGDGETLVLLCELLEEDYKAQDRVNRDLNDALNNGDGAYRP